MERASSLVVVGVLVCVLMTSAGLAVGQINLLQGSWNDRLLGEVNQRHTETSTPRPRGNCEAYLTNDNPNCWFDTTSCTMVCNPSANDRAANAWTAQNEVAQNNRPKSSGP